MGPKISTKKNETVITVSVRRSIHSHENHFGITICMRGKYSESTPILDSVF